MNRAGPDAAAEGFADLLFARGYLIGTLGEPQLPPGWTRRAFGGWSVWHDPRLDYAEAPGPAGGEPCVACLGVILDAERPRDPPEAVLARLAEALGRSEDALLRALDTAAGRFVLLYRSEGRTHLVTDAAGTKQAYRYGRETTLVASHARLIARNAEGAKRQDVISAKGGYPGLDTPWRGVHLLTPNTRLRLEDMQVRRFYPRRKLKGLSVERAAEEVAQLMRGTMEHLATRRELHLSVSAGLDSRMTLALARDLPVRLFTFQRADKKGDNPLDVAFARTLQREQGREVRIVSLDEHEAAMPEGFRAVVVENTLARHLVRLAWAFHTEVPQDGRAVHLRSNLSEIGRQFYRRMAWPKRPRPHDLARLHLRDREDLKVSKVFSVIECYERFAEVTGILECEGLIDVPSLFYWEHRMGVWFANAAAEADVGIDTISPFNCRRIFELLLRVSRESRVGSAVHRRIVAEHAPELTAYPVNGEVLWP